MAPADGLTITILGFVLSVCLVAIYIIRYRMSPRRSPARRFAVREGKVLRVAVGVMLNLIISTYAFYSIVLLRVTPTANRNSYRVARLVGCLPRVADFARNPGLGKRNSFRVAAACEGFIRGGNPLLAASICGLYQHKKPWRLLSASPFCGCR